MQQRKDNSGALFKNDRKDTDSRPDYKGSAMIDGSEYFMIAWINESSSGVKYMSLRFTLKEQAHNNGVKSARKAVQEPLEFDQDIPF